MTALLPTRLALVNPPEVAQHWAMLKTVPADLGTAILVRHIMTPIGLVHPVHGEDPAHAVYERMKRKNYHATTVLRDGVVTGWVTRDDLVKHAGQQVESVRRAVTTDVLIGAESSVHGLLQRFLERNFLLVVGDSGIEGIATPSDVGRQAGRMHLFMQTCALELAVATLARGHDDLDSVLSKVFSDKDRRGIATRLRRRIEHGEVADTVAVLYFIDLLRIGQVLVPGWGDVDRSQIYQLGRFRNTIVHAPNEIADDGLVTIQNVVSNLDLVRRLLTAI